MTKGMVTFTDEGGKFHAHEIDIPIDYNTTIVAWVQDFWNLFLERPKFLRWIAKLAMGKYAYRELYGALEAMKKRKIPIDAMFANDESLEYYKDKVSLDHHYGG